MTVVTMNGDLEGLADSTHEPLSCAEIRVHLKNMTPFVTNVAYMSSHHNPK